MATPKKQHPQLQKKSIAKSRLGWINQRNVLVLLNKQDQHILDQ
jgi:hypothetical protein